MMLHNKCPNKANAIGDGTQQPAGFLSETGVGTCTLCWLDACMLIVAEHMACDALGTATTTLIAYWPHVCR